MLHRHIRFHLFQLELIQFLLTPEQGYPQRLIAMALTELFGPWGLIAYRM